MLCDVGELQLKYPCRSAFPSSPPTLQVASLESRLLEVGGANKELTTLKFELEAGVRELGAKLKSSQEVKGCQSMGASYELLL